MKLSSAAVIATQYCTPADTARVSASWHDCYNVKQISNSSLPWTGYAALPKQYKINSPDTFVDRLIDIADARIMSYNNMPGTLSTLSKADWAAYALKAFAGSHILRDSVNFYANQSVSRRQMPELLSELCCPALMIYS